MLPRDAGLTPAGTHNTQPSAMQVGDDKPMTVVPDDELAWLVAHSQEELQGLSDIATDSGQATQQPSMTYNQELRQQVHGLPAVVLESPFKSPRPTQTILVPMPAVAGKRTASDADLAEEKKDKDKKRKAAERAEHRTAANQDPTHPDNSPGGVLATRTAWDNMQSYGVRESLIRKRHSPKIAEIRADKMHSEKTIWISIARDLHLVRVLTPACLSGLFEPLSACLGCLNSCLPVWAV